VGGEIVRSNIICRGSVQVMGSGRIIGGTISAGSQVIARTIGSSVGRAQTRIFLPNIRGWRADGAGVTEAEEADGAAKRDAVADARARESLRIALKVRGVIYPPTSIAIGHARKNIDLEFEHAMFTEGAGEIIMAPYS
jgi:hypothetical protein